MFFLLFFFLSSALASSDLICSSLPEFEPYDTSLYFACTCPQEGMEGQFSLASFAYNLSHSIFDRSLVVDLRDCLSMDIIMDQLQLNLVQSDYFRPDIHFKEINVENMFQVHLVKSSSQAQDSSNPQTADYVNYPSNQMDVHLYDVNNVLVDIEAELEHLTTDWEETKLHIDGATKNIKSEDHPLSIAGFKQSNIFFRTDDNKDAFKQMIEVRDVLHGLRTAVLTRSKQMSLGLSLCVFVLTLGVGAMMFAIIKRHQLVLESIVYSSIGSLRRIKDKNYIHKNETKSTNKTRPESRVSGHSERESNNEVTTTTQVAFFPRYSVVNKSQRGTPRYLNEKKTVKTNQESKKNATKQVRDVKTKEEQTIKSHVNSTNEIFSTLKFKANRKPQPIPKVPKSELNKTSTSFYCSSDSSSKYDLTLKKTSTQVAAQVHQANYGQNTATSVPEVAEQVHLASYSQNTAKIVPKGSAGEHKDHDWEKSSSPQPLLPSEKIYSFNTLREKCRKMIAGSKPFQDSTRL